MTRRETDGSRPSAGCFSLIEVREAFNHLGEELTVSEIADSGLISWRDATKKDSVKRRVRRCLSILQDAGYISEKTHPQDRRKTLYVAQGLTHLRIPGDDKWHQATESLK
jgi:hypothetical protein